MTRWQAFLLVLGGACPAACNNEYPIPATFCDDFCRATLRPGCDSEPEDCVRECELQAVGPACQTTHEQLLSCYQRAPDDAFVCSGFGSSVRVQDGVCGAERDALLSCELPSIEPCLQFCRPYQAQLDEQVQAERFPPDAALTERCPLLRQPCEGICWNLLTIGSLEVDTPLDAAQLPTTFTPGTVVSDAGSQDLLATVATLLQGCGL